MTFAVSLLVFPFRIIWLTFNTPFNFWQPMNLPWNTKRLSSLKTIINSSLLCNNPPSSQFVSCDHFEIAYPPALSINSFKRLLYNIWIWIAQFLHDICRLKLIFQLANNKFQISKRPKPCLISKFAFVLRGCNWTGDILLSKRRWDWFSKN